MFTHWNLDGHRFDAFLAVAGTSKYALEDKGRSPRVSPTKEQAESWATREESVYKLIKLTEDAQWPTVLELGMAYAEAKLKNRASYWKAQMMARQLGESFPLPINQLTPKMVNDFKFKRLIEVRGGDL